MSIVHKLDCQGGFTCGDSDSRVTAYAFPSSTYARRAKRHPDEIATEMLRCERRFGFSWELDSDARNWRTLAGEAGR